MRRAQALGNLEGVLGLERYYNYSMIGTRFDRLTVIGRGGRKYGQIAWACACDCGGYTIATTAHLRDGRKRSCGCIKREHVARLSAAKVTHGRTHTVEYRIWGGIIDRCTNPRGKDWANYGGRGIAVDPRWRVFENFLADMGRRPAPTLSVDRIDNDGPYAPGNCRWATHRVQSRNSRQNVLYEYGGRVKPLCDWADESGINRITFYWRFKQGWRGHRLFSRYKVPSNS